MTVDWFYWFSELFLVFLLACFCKLFSPLISCANMRVVPNRLNQLAIQKFSREDFHRKSIDTRKILVLEFWPRERIYGILNSKFSTLIELFGSFWLKQVLSLNKNWCVLSFCVQWIKNKHVSIIRLFTVFIEQTANTLFNGELHHGIHFEASSMILMESQL